MSVSAVAGDTGVMSVARDQCDVNPASAQLSLSCFLPAGYCWLLLLSPSHCLMSLSVRSQVMEDGAAVHTVRHQAQAQSSDGEPVLAPEEEHPAETESDVLEE